MSATLTPVKFSDPAYNGGAVSDGWITSDGFLIEPGNTNGNFTDPWGWYLAQFQAAALELDPETAGKVRGDCAATGITPQSTWEYIGKPLVIMAAAVAGGEALGAAGGAGAGTSTLAPTVIAAPAAPVAAAPIAVGSVGDVSAGLGTIGAVGGTTASAGALSGLGGALATGAEQVGEKVALGAALTALAPSPPKPTGSSAPQRVTSHGGMGWLLILAAGAAGLFLFSGAV